MAIFFFLFFGNAQECSLAIGSKNQETAIKIFQMSDAQINTMETAAAALSVKVKEIEESIQKLFDTHPQGTPDELTQLSGKYKLLEEKIVVAQHAADAQVLSSFNSKQYARYLSLCQEALREPIKVVPAQAKDSLVDPE